MEKTNLLTLVITLTVGIILAGSLLMPVISDATETERIFTNDGRYYIQTEIDGETTITMNYDIDGTTRQWFIDDVLLEIADHPTGAEYITTSTVVGTDNYVFRTDGRFRGLSSGAGSSDYTLTVTADAITNNTIVGHAPLFIASTETTDNVFRNDPSKAAYVLDDSRILACGYTGNIKTSASDASGVDVVISIDGSIKDGFQVTIFNKDYTFSADNIVINATAINGYNSLYNFTSIEFDVLATDETATHCIYSMVVLPASVTAELSNHLNPGEIAIMNALPVLIIVALVVMAIGALYLKRDD